MKNHFENRRFLVKFVKVLRAFLMFAAALPALAASRTVTLAVPGMTCPVCPITVKKALKAVPGVSKVDVSFAKKDAVVTFDDAKTSVAALTKATADAGYPSKPEGTAK
jgi:mercuric ion binding protein